jgi:hypothetical protein
MRGGVTYGQFVFHAVAQWSANVFVIRDDIYAINVIYALP